MRGLGNLALLLVVGILALIFWGLLQDTMGGSTIGVQPPVTEQNPSDDPPDPPPVQPTAPPVTPTATNPPPEPTMQTTTAWTCPGQSVENGGCQVASTTDVPANACVDYDPRGDDRPVGSYETIDTDQTRQRVRFTQPGQIVLAGGQATIYTNNYCPPYN